MPDNKCVLLVEGRSDEAFFSAVCARLGLNSRVHVAPPKEVGGRSNNKESALNHLPLLLRQFIDGRLERLALVVDADHEQEGGLGDARTIERVTQIVTEHGFVRRGRDIAPGGQFFESKDGFADFALWVMPGTRADGGLEDWVKLCLPPPEAPLVAEVQVAINGLANPKFKPLHRTKAEVATWLAWQKAPGRGLESAVKDELLAFEAQRFRDLEIWLRAAFP